VRFILPLLLGRIPRRWPTFLAIAFCLYSTALLTYSMYIQQKMREESNGFLVADSTRRAAALGDVVVGLREKARDYADLYEIRTFLINRDLGMSPRYGLNYSLEMIVERFKERAVQDAERWGTLPPRIAYFSEGGELLADTNPQADALILPGEDAGKEVLTLDTVRGLVLIVTPVRFRNRQEGQLVVAAPIEVMYRNLLVQGISSGYRELLMTDTGEYLRPIDALGSITTTAIARIPEDSVLRFSDVVTSGTPELALRDSLMLKSRVPGVALSIVTFVSNEHAHDNTGSIYSLFAVGTVPLLLLFLAFRLDKLRLGKELLQEQIRASEQERLRVEIRNSELIDEIERRVAVEHALRDSDERWQLAVSGTNDGVWDWNPMTGETFFSLRWKSMLGYAEADLDGNVEEWRSRIHPDDLAQTLAEMQRHLHGESRFYECEHRLRCKNGSYKWVLARGRALFDESGSATRVSGSHTDMTERRLGEALLQDRTEQLNVIFELSPDGFISFDAARRVKYASPAFIRMAGIPQEQINGLDEQEFSSYLAQLCSDGGRFRGVAALRESAARGEKNEREIIRLSQGVPCFLEVGLRASESSSVSQILYFRDVTYETEVDRMKSEFLSTAAHELRTPMASIFGFAEVLLTQDFDEAIRHELLSIIHKQSSLMASILNELLDLARIEERRGKDFVFEATDVQALVNEVVSEFKLPEGRSLPTLLMPADPLFIMADHKKAQQAILNVLSNAYKYSPEGGDVSVTIERAASDANLDALTRPLPAMAVIRILDNGIGMTAEQLERVCQRFYRADASGKIPGTGLGMSITKEIINLHHGVIEMTSQMGQGAVVTLKFPVFTGF